MESLEILKWVAHRLTTVFKGLKAARVLLSKITNCFHSPTRIRGAHGNMALQFPYKRLKAHIRTDFING